VADGHVPPHVRGHPRRDHGSGVRAPRPPRAAAPVPRAMGRYGVAHYHPEGRRIFEAFANGRERVHRARRRPAARGVPAHGLRPGPWSATVALLRTQTAMPLGDARSELALAQNVVQFGVEEANRRARPSPYRELVPAEGVDLRGSAGGVGRARRHAHRRRASRAAPAVPRAGSTRCRARTPARRRTRRAATTGRSAGASPRAAA
jgi:hypothetical protein